MTQSATPLIAQTLLETAVVAWAGWEVWKLRTPRPPKARDAPPPSAGAPGHAIGEHPLDDR